MTLKELSVEYRTQATILHGRIEELRVQMSGQEEDQKSAVEARIRMLAVMWREARDLAVLCEHYYDRGYRRNGKYTL